MATRIIVKISPSGQIETTVDGVKGTGCSALLDALTAQLGKVTEDTATAEYYESEAQEETEYNS